MSLGQVPDPSFWRCKRVLLTGHTGFKGSWLALWLAPNRRCSPRSISRRTIDWYQAFYQDRDAGRITAFTLDQIGAYYGPASSAPVPTRAA